MYQLLYAKSAFKTPKAANPFLCLLFAYAYRAVESLINISYSTSVKIFYRGLTEVFIASPSCDKVHEGRVKCNHLPGICGEPR